MTPAVEPNAIPTAVDLGERVATALARETRGSFEMFRKAPFADTVRRLSVISTTRGLFAVAWEWLIIGCAAGLALWAGHWAAYLVAIIVIGSRQHALAILMHDASHYRIARNRLVNDIVSDLFLAFPIGVSTNLYRRRHLEHHRHTNTDLDPDWVDMRIDDDWRWPKLRLESARLFLFDLLGLNAFKTLKILSHWSPWPRLFQPAGQADSLTARERICLVGLIAATLATLAATGLWIPFALLWLVPSFTVLGAIFRIRSIAEHLVLENTCELNASRTVQPTWWERMLLAPCGVNFHLEHHLFPSVPFYNLGKLHRALMADPIFRAKAHLTESYLGLSRGVLAELTSTRPAAIGVGASSRLPLAR